MQEITNPLTNMNELHMIPGQPNQTEGGWPPKLQEHRTSEDPPKHITRSTKTSRPKGSPKEKMIGEFRELSIKALTGMMNEMEPPPDAEARVDQWIEKLSQQFPDLFPKPH